MKSDFDILFPTRQLPNSVSQQKTTAETDTVKLFDRNHRNQPRVRTDAEGRLMPESQCWGNLGWWVHNERTNESMFVTLPFNIPLDTMSFAKEDGIFGVNKNNLLKHILQLFEDEFQPGEDIIHPIGDTGFYFQFLKKQDQESKNEARTMQPVQPASLKRKVVNE